MTESSVFISYSRMDTEIVVPLVQLLRLAGSGVFRDYESIPLGVRWRATIAKAISDCDIFLLFWCKHSAESREVKVEWDQAINLEKLIVPALLDKTSLPPLLAEFQGIDMRGIMGDHRIEYQEVMVERKVYDSGIIPGEGGRSRTEWVKETKLRHPSFDDLLRGGNYLYNQMNSLIGNRNRSA